MSAIKMIGSREIPLPARPQRGMSDIGRVILPEGTHGMIEEEIVLIPPVPGAIKALRLCVEKYGAKNMFLVSRVLNNRQELLEAWLKEQKIFEQTGLLNNEEHVIWCSNWRAKGPILRDLGITFCVDDQPDVHLSVEAAYNDLKLSKDDPRLRQYGLNYTASDLELYLQAPTRVRLIRSWDEFIEMEGL